MKQILLISLIFTSTVAAFAQSFQASTDKADRSEQKLVLRVQPGDKFSGRRELESDKDKSKVLLGFKNEDTKDKRSFLAAQLKVGSGTGGWDHENPQSVLEQRQKTAHVNLIIRSYSLRKCEEAEMTEALKTVVDAQAKTIDIDIHVDSQEQFDCLEKAIANLAN